jgi:hypothetical protein
MSCLLLNTQAKSPPQAKPTAPQVNATAIKHHQEPITIVTDSPPPSQHHISIAMFNWFFIKTTAQTTGLNPPTSPSIPPSPTTNQQAGTSHKRCRGITIYTSGARTMSPILMVLVAVSSAYVSGHITSVDSKLETTVVDLLTRLNPVVVVLAYPGPHRA